MIFLQTILFFQKKVYEHSSKLINFYFWKVRHIKQRFHIKFLTITKKHELVFVKILQ